tara:strand:- start:6508 stop:6885 length:378 start_codon:yes stop_codon:yes gene_type:complete
MPQPAVQVENLGKVIRQMKAIEPELVEELKAANRDIADKVTTTAKVLAPRKSGKLSNSVRPGATARTGLVRAGSKRVPYAAVQHFGWAKRNIKPDPFLYDALDDRRDEVEAAYLAAITKITGRID